MCKGYILERTVGMKLDEYFRKKIFAPLGIAETEFLFFPVKGFGDRMPYLNPQDPKGEGTSVGAGMSVHTEGDMSCYGGQGGYSSSEAYVAVLESICANDGKLLTPESVEEMFKPQLEKKAKEVFNTLLNDPSTSYFGQGTSSANRDFGLTGVLLLEDRNERGLEKGTITQGSRINSI